MPQTKCSVSLIMTSWPADESVFLRSGWRWPSASSAVVTMQRPVQGRTRERPHESVAATPARESLRPWTASERRYCHEPRWRCRCTCNMRASCREPSTTRDRGNGASPMDEAASGSGAPEISEAVNTLATISDRYYDMVAATNYHFDLLAGAAESTGDVPGAQRRYHEHASYLREHCGITFG